MDIPPQYGPAFKGGFEDNQSEYFKIVIGTVSFIYPLLPQEMHFTYSS